MDVTEPENQNRPGAPSWVNVKDLKIVHTVTSVYTLKK